MSEHVAKPRKRVLKIESFDEDEIAALLGAVSLQIERCGPAKSLEESKVITSLFTVRAKILAALGSNEKDLAAASNIEAQS